MPLKKHLFFCVNQRSDNKRCCANRHSQAIFEYAKQRLTELGQHHRDGYRVNRAGCLGRCADGPSLVIYPEGVWYTVKTFSDVDTILEQHIAGDQIVASLLMPERAVKDE